MLALREPPTSSSPNVPRSNTAKREEAAANKKAAEEAARKKAKCNEEDDVSEQFFSNAPSYLAVMHVMDVAADVGVAYALILVEDYAKPSTHK